MSGICNSFTRYVESLRKVIIRAVNVDKYTIIT